MKKLITISVLIALLSFVSAQNTDTVPDLSKGGYTIANLSEDTIKLRDKASATLRALRDGAVIVRLKTNEKSVEAYRKAGRPDIAERITEARKVQNEKIYLAFDRHFKFCRVYFIYANQTKDFLNGNHRVFLNHKLEVDPSIVFNDTTFVFCEYGSVESFSHFNDYILRTQASGNDIAGRVHSNKTFDTVPVKTSTSPATTSGLFFSDKNLKQFYRPFPYAEGVYLDNFTPAVTFLNARLFRQYNMLVSRKDYQDKVKENRKQQKTIKKKEEKSKYNPFE